MAGTGFTITGIKSFEKFRANVDATFKMSVWEKKLKTASEIAYKKAYQLCPVDTGWMQGQLKLYQTDSLHFILECNVEYASYNEYGWYGIPPVPNPPAKVHYKNNYRPFMRIEIITGEKWFVKEIEKEVQKRLKSEHG